MASHNHNNDPLSVGQFVKIDSFNKEGVHTFLFGFIFSFNCDIIVLEETLGTQNVYSSVCCVRFINRLCVKDIVVIDESNVYACQKLPEIVSFCWIFWLGYITIFCGFRITTFFSKWRKKESRMQELD